MLLRPCLMRHNKPIGHYVKIFICLGIRKFINTPMDEGCWQLEDGSKIKFWMDCWFSRPLAEFLHLLVTTTSVLRASAKYSIVDHVWNIPLRLITTCPYIMGKISQVTIPIDPGGCSYLEALY